MGRNNGYRGRGNRPLNLDVGGGNIAQCTTWIRDYQIAGPGTMATHEWADTSDPFYRQQTTKVLLTDDGMAIYSMDYLGRGMCPTIQVKSCSNVNELIGLLRSVQQQLEHPGQKITIPEITITDSNKKLILSYQSSDDPALAIIEIQAVNPTRADLLPPAIRSGYWYLPAAILHGVMHDLQQIQQQWQHAKGIWEDAYPAISAQWRHDDATLYRQQHVQSLHQQLLQPRIRS